MSSTSYNHYEGDGIIYTNKPDKFTVEQHDFAGRAIYEIGTNLRDAKIHLDRATRSAGDAIRWKADDDQLESVKQSARDCEMQLAKLIAYLCREPVPAEVATSEAA